MRTTLQIVNRYLLGSLVIALTGWMTNTSHATASIGTPNVAGYANITNSTTPPVTNDLTHIGPFGDLDWQIFDHATLPAIPPTTTKLGGTNITLSPPVTNIASGVILENLGTATIRSFAYFSWSDGTTPTSSAGVNPGDTGFKINTANTFALDANYETVSFVPGDTKPHTAYLFVYYGGGAKLSQLQFETSLNGVATPPTTTITLGVSTNYIYSVQFQANSPSDALAVKLTFAKTSTSTTATGVGINAAAIANYAPPLVAWQGNNSGNWDTSTVNWTNSSGTPVAYSDSVGAQFDDTATSGRFNVNVSSTVNPLGIYVNNSANDYTIGGSPIAGSGQLVKTGSSTLTLSGANTFSGGVIVSGGYLTLGASGTLPNGAGAGDLTISAGGTLNPNGFNQTVNGMNGAGNIDIPTASGGTSTLTVGNNNASSVFSGLIQNTFGTVGLIKTGSGSLTLSGTNNTFSGGVQLNAGQLNINSVTAIGSGTLTIAGSTTLDNTSGATKTLSNNNPQSWNGDFTVLGSSSLNMGSGAVAMSGSRAITVSSNTFTVGGVISGSGGLTKNGAGQLTISGSNTFSGPITVNAGTLQMNTTSKGGGGIALADGANLSVTLSASETTLGAASLKLGATSGNTNNLTFLFGVNTNHSTAIVTATNLITSNSVVVNIQASANTPLVPGEYPLIKYTGSIGGAGFGAFSLGTTPANSVMSLTNNTANQSVDLIITVITGPAITWVGYANGSANSTWDIITTTNWLDSTGTNPVGYAETILAGNAVLFNDTASNFVVNVSTAVKPAAITVNNTNNDYTISGSPITGLASLNKQGAMGLTLSGANTFSNGVTLTGGTLRVGSGTPLGTGLLTLYSSGVTLSSDSTTARTVTNAVLARNNFKLGNPSNNGVVTLSGPMNLNNGNQAITLYSDAVLSGGSTNGGIDLAAPINGNTLTLLGGVHNWNQQFNINGNTMVLNGVLVTNSYVTTLNSGNFDIACSVSNSIACLSITNGGALVFTDSGAVVRFGYSQNGGNTAGGLASLSTNELDVAGLFATPNSNNKMIMGRSAYLSVLNLWPGGTLQVGGISGSDILANNCPTLVNLNGGTLKPTANTTTFMQGITNAYVLAGGAIFNTSGNDITVNQQLLSGASPDGGLTKNGTGTLTLGGANTYTGTNTVNQGELVLPTSVTGGGAIAVADAGSLGVKIVIPNQTLNAAAIALGKTAVHNGTLDITLGTNSLSSTAVLTTTSVLSAIGTNTITLTGTNVVAGQFPLISYSGGSFAGSFSAFKVGSMPAGYSGTLSNNTANSSIDLVIATATSISQPKIATVTYSGGNLTFNATNGTSGGAYSVVTSTNVTIPLASWTTVTTGNFDGTGACSVSIPVNNTTPSQFYSIKQ